MVALTLTLQIIAAAVAVTATPVKEAHIEARQALEARQGGIDVGRNCGSYQPYPGDCGVLTSTTQLALNTGDHWATLVDSSCGIVDAETYEPQGHLQGHRAELSLPSGRVVSVHQSYLSAEGISVPTIEIDGVRVEGVDCDSQTRQRNDGGLWRFWRMCAFPC